MLYNCPICQILTSYKWLDSRTSSYFYACSKLHALRYRGLDLVLGDNPMLNVIELVDYSKFGSRFGSEPAEVARKAA